MFDSVVTKLVGSRNQRLLKRVQRTHVVRINQLADNYAALSDHALQAKTDEFKQCLAEGANLDDLLPEAFALVREASARTLNMRHFDVQLVGGVVLHQGKIAEMHTGEGKTLAATLPAYLNALTGQGVHIVTVNSYLAERDADWMRPIYEFLGMSVGVVVAGMSPEARRDAYAADITYGTNNEFGFDYLRDNMAFEPEERVQRGHAYAIVDEVDSILIDEARTPLIISGEVEESSALYLQINELVKQLQPAAAPANPEQEPGPGDFLLDEKDQQVHLTEQGQEQVEALLKQHQLLSGEASLYHPSNIGLIHHVLAALRAQHLFRRDVQYIVQDGQVVIVDEHTGRTMPGRRWSDGLHQAMEAKEGLDIHNENQTLASITFQNYFRQYQKLAGMTGTADTEAFEFRQIYGLEVVVMPTHKPMIRQDFPDRVYVSKREKYAAIVADIKRRHDKGQPVLVGTASIESSEALSEQLNAASITHQVLNAKFHEQEASIIAQAGCVGTVTIATNMAGRGTDIVLGGNVEAQIANQPGMDDVQATKLRTEWQSQHDQVLSLGGLHVLGAERNESRRIDNQLRGRSGRQGDPGSSEFFLSLEDDLMRIFASDKVAPLMRRLGMTEGETIQHSMLTRAIENAQRKVEGHNFDIRKQLLRFDDIANEQRQMIYAQRNELIELADISDTIRSMREGVMRSLVAQFVPPETLTEAWNISGLTQTLLHEFTLDLPIQSWLDSDAGLDEAGLIARVLDAAEKAYTDKETRLGSEIMRHLEKALLLQEVDVHWREHLNAMEHLRQGIHLRGYAQKNPIQEFKREAFELFSEMLTVLKRGVIAKLYLIEVQTDADVTEMEAAAPIQMNFAHGPMVDEQANQGDDVQQVVPKETVAPMQRQQPKVGRNQACPCGSGKKYKHCHGKI